MAVDESVEVGCPLCRNRVDAEGWCGWCLAYTGHCQHGMCSHVVVTHAGEAGLCLEHGTEFGVIVPAAKPVVRGTIVALLILLVVLAAVGVGAMIVGSM